MNEKNKPKLKRTTIRLVQGKGLNQQLLGGFSQITRKGNRKVHFVLEMQVAGISTPLTYRQRKKICPTLRTTT